MKNITIIILSIAVMASAGCGKTHCPAFPPHLVAYYPYSVGDVLKFANPDNDTVAYKVSSVETSGKESFSWNCACSCGFSHRFATEIDTSAPKRLFMESVIYGGDNEIEIMCYITDSYHGDHLYFTKENINPHDPESIRLLEIGRAHV